MAANKMGLAPSEFWDMTMPELLLLHEEKRDAQPGDYAGGLRRADVERLSKLLED